MTTTNNAKQSKAAEKNRAAEVANTFEWLITAFILAFIFRAFVMEAFRIPTGSMAETLMGAHFRMRCPQCGYKYNHGFVPQNYGLPQDVVPGGGRRPPRTRCPSCGHDYLAPVAQPVANGDRILVLKCIYQFFEPKQWDVVVFKNPLDPTENYIKRLAGRPGETVEIIDGDVYINDEISHKPPAVQDELWMPVYNNDYQPVRPKEGRFNGHFWRQPFDTDNSLWEVDSNNVTRFLLNSPSGEVHWLKYDSSVGNDFRATYAYDNVDEYSRLPYCSDLMVRFYVRSDSSLSNVGIELSKYESRYRGWIDSDGEMVIARTTANEDTEELGRKTIKPVALGRLVRVRFSNVDHQLSFEVGAEKLTCDLGHGPDDAGARKTDIQPQVKVFGSGKLMFSHVAVFRDIHYTAANGPRPGLAGEGAPLKLDRDQFFVLGDNSPKSLDSRWWGQNGIGNNNSHYRTGIVPRNYLVGKALFVYWPSFIRPFGKSSFVFVPNVGKMRFIYGGSDKTL